MIALIYLIWHVIDPLNWAYDRITVLLILAIEVAPELNAIRLWMRR